MPVRYGKMGVRALHRDPFEACPAAAEAAAALDLQASLKVLEKCNEAK